MATYSERRRRRLFGPRIAIAAGVIVMLIGLYTIFGISGQTNKKIEKCTEQTKGVVTDVMKSGSKYLMTIEYTPGYEPVTTMVESKKEYPIGTELTVNFEPMYFSNIYIEGFSKTGSADRLTGIIEVAAGLVLAILGILLEASRKTEKRRR